MTYDIQGVCIEATVTSIRAVRWASLRPNFLVLLSPHALRDAPQTWIAALPTLPPEARTAVQARLAERFPTVSTFDVSEAAARIGSMVSRIALASGAEFLVGQGRYRFEAVPVPPGESASPGANHGSTPPGSANAFALLGGASLAEVAPAGLGTRVSLTLAEYWIGSDPSCVFRRDSDPFVEPRHVRLSRDGKGAWQAQHSKSLNGLWLRVPQVTVEEGCLFQIGEQRLRLKTGE